MPRFINCDWVAQLLRAGHIEPQNGTEKGHSHCPIMIPLYNPALTFCTLQSLIDMWHDALGVCRAAEQAGNVLVLSISRFLPETGLKNMQQIQIDSTVRFPYFLNDEGDVHFYLFEVCALIFHLGQSPHTGHYKAVLNCNDKWLMYDDGQIPEPLDILTADILTNVVMVWLIPARGTDARHMLERRRTDLRDGPLVTGDQSMTPR